MSKTHLLTLFILSLFSVAIYAQSGGQVLMTVGGKDVTVEEFRYIYEKNNGDGADYSAASVQEYIDLYSRFKLKVAEAKAMGLDTVSVLNQELDGYRKQLADSYIMDKEVLKSLTRELYDRKQQDVRLSHILVSVSKRANAGEVDSKLKTAQDLLIRLKRGEDFTELARTFSEDNNTNKNGGDFGWLTAKLPNGFYDFESAMYELKVGEVSDIVRSPLGFHIMKVTERRPARGLMKVAHILKRTDQANPSLAKMEIDKIFAELSSGSDFATLVKEKSDDEKTANNGGELAPFGIKVFEKSFEDAAFELQKNGDFSRPVKTKIGWHIIKRLDKMDFGTYDDYEAISQSSLKNDERYEKQKNRVVEEIKKNAGYKFHPEVLKEYASTLDSDVYTYKWKPTAINDKVLFSFGDKKDYMLSQFVTFLKSNTKLRLRFDNGDPIDESINSLYEDFTREATLKYEQSNLEQRHPEYRALMREYEEGILLFEVSKREVWDKASQDTLGLHTYYDANKKDFMWLPRAELATYTAKVENEDKAKDIYECAKKKDHEKLLKKINKKEQVLTAEIKKVERASKALGAIEWAKGARSEMVYDPKLGEVRFDKILKIIDPAIKTLEEARGYVIADYQEQLEKEWVKSLKKKYAVNVNEEVVKQLIK